MKVYLDAYLFNNLGDDLFVEIVRRRYPNTKFYAISRFYKEKPNVKVYSGRITNKLLENQFLKNTFVANKCDLVLSVGGSMYIEESNKKKNFSLGKNKYYIMGSNFGPYKTEEYYNRYYEFFKNAEDVCFREKHSYNLFKDLPNVRHASDIVFGLDTSKFKKSQRKRVIISIISCDMKLLSEYKEAYEKKIVELIYFFKKKGYEVCLMSYCQIERDEEAINSIISKCKEEVETYYYRGNIEEALEVMNDCQIVVGSRFHANILGLVLGKTIIPIGYSDKTKNALLDLGYKGKIIDIRNIDKFNVEELTRRRFSTSTRCFKTNTRCRKTI